LDFLGFGSHPAHECELLFQADSGYTGGMRRGRRAFTLIELLVVISIIAILATLLVPAMSRAKGLSHSISCKNKLRQLGIALRLYVDDNRSEYPAFEERPGPGHWYHPLYPYIRIAWTNQAFHCPAFKGPIRDWNYGLATDFSNSSGSYGYNAWGTAAPLTHISQLGLGGLQTTPSSIRPVKESEVKAPSEMFAIADSRVIEGPLAAFPVMWQWSGHWVEPAAARKPRHENGYNALFCDGHVLSIKRSLLVAAKYARNFNRDNEPHLETYYP
jgi:prepilin-type N-terminal cleavage/methylation domain-containing protein/prepilin-type processing-associated H-X9-DG protein